jgi:hypothetical protein
MDAYIKLKSGNDVLITDIKCIRRPDSQTGAIKETTDFANFTINRTVYTFVGNEIVVLPASEIEYVKFNPTN